MEAFVDLKVAGGDLLEGPGSRGITKRTGQKGLCSGDDAVAIGQQKLQSTWRSQRPSHPQQSRSRFGCIQVSSADIQVP